MRLRFGLLVVVLLNGCSSSDFEVSEQSTTDAAADSGTSTSDTGNVVPDAPPPVDAGPNDTAGCTALGTDPATIYVNGLSAGGFTGTADCPFKTIADALAVPMFPSSRRTIKIAGGTYTETSATVVGKDIALVGDGSDRVTIRGSGPCSATSPSSCVVVLQGGASIEGVTINAGPAIGLALTPGDATITSAKSLVVTGGTVAANPGVYVLGKGTVSLGPEVRAKDNAGVGLVIESALVTNVSKSSFDGNAGGIVVKGGAINIDGGQTLANKTHGVALLSTARHNIINFASRENLAAGVFVEANASLKMRTSTLVKNRYGMIFRSGTNDLDLGTLDHYGENIFGGPSAYNSKAGICVPLVRASKAPAVGNKWLVCEPARALVPSGGCEAISLYQDVYYAGTSISDPPPLDWSACDPGP